jgi:hypothetical protein
MADEGEDVTLTASFSDPNQGPDDSERVANSWAIFWGDGTYSEQFRLATCQPTHSYTAAGEFTMTVVADYVEEDSSQNWDVTGVYEAQTLVPIEIDVSTPAITAVGDTTATVTGDTYSLSLGFTNALAPSHPPLYWQVAWGDGVTDIYREQLPQDATHVYATASTSGTSYSPAVTAYTDEGSYTPTAAPNVDVAQPMMQVLQADGSPMDHDAQHTLGAFIAIDDNDSDGNYDAEGNPITENQEASLALQR